MRTGPRRAGAGLALVILAVATLGPGTSVAGQAAPELELRLRQAERSLQQGDTMGALLEVEAVLGRDDRFWKAYWVRGRIQARMGDDLGARDSFLRAVELDPGNAELHFLVAGLAVQLADFETGARQMIAAAQAGYDLTPLRAMAESMRDYVAQPPDLARAIAAPRVRVEEVSFDDRPLTELVRELRTLLLEAPDVALVQLPPLAPFVVRLTRVPADAGVAARVTVQLIAVSSGDTLLEHDLSGDGLQARVELGEIANDIAERVNR